MMKLAMIFACASVMLAADWSAPVDVLHEMKPCVTYRARVEGDILVVQASLQPGWHTFTIDNERRAAEKLAGKPSLGIDQPTQIRVSKGLELVGAVVSISAEGFLQARLAGTVGALNNRQFSRRRFVRWVRVPRTSRFEGRHAQRRHAKMSTFR